MFSTLATAVLPLAILMCPGWLGGRHGHFQRSDVAALATVVTRDALPVSLFLGALTTPPDKLGKLPFPVCMSAGFVGTCVIALLAGRHRFGHDLKTSALQAPGCTFPDMAYFGAPILAQVCGRRGFIAVLVGHLITSLVILPATIVPTGWGGRDGTGVAAALRASGGKALRSPPVWMPLMGIATRLCGATLPAPLREITASMLAVRNGNYATRASDSVLIGTVMAVVGQAALIPLIA